MKTQGCLTLNHYCVGSLRVSLDPQLLPMFSPLWLPSLQVTDGKQDLERASQLARKIKKEAASLSEWLSLTETELVQKSTSEGLLSDLDTEISWAKVSCSSGTPILCQRDLWHFCSGQSGWMSFSSILY